MLPSDNILTTTDKIDMAVNEFIIGLDFGTHQSKACVLHLSTNPQKHHFISFPLPDGTSSYFLPTQVYLNKDDTFDYGYPSHIDTSQPFSFFKIAAAEDEYFHSVTDLHSTTRIYKRGEYGELSPEFLSAVFIAYILFVVKEQLKAHTQIQKRLTLFKEDALEKQNELDFIIQMGIPTEYLRTINIMRKRKFENILLISEMIQKKVLDLL